MKRRGPYRVIGLETRFWKKVNKTKSCWLWTASKHEFGYGIIGEDHSRNTLKAHRVSWKLANGEIPPGLQVLHKCDNPSCVNPKHLFLGTQSDNVKDMSRKGRHVGSRKLTPEQVKWIRKHWVFRVVTCPQMAKQFGVSKECVWAALRCVNWSNV